MNLETKITIYKFTPQVFTLTLKKHLKRIIIGIVRDNGWADFYPLPESARGYSEKRKPA